MKRVVISLLLLLILSFTSAIIIPDPPEAPNYTEEDYYNESEFFNNTDLYSHSPPSGSSTKSTSWIENFEIKPYMIWVFLGIAVGIFILVLIIVLVVLARRKRSRFEVMKNVYSGVQDRRGMSPVYS